MKLTHIITNLAVRGGGALLSLLSIVLIKVYGIPNAEELIFHLSVLYLLSCCFRFGGDQYFIKISSTNTFLEIIVFFYTRSIPILLIIFIMYSSIFGYEAIQVLLFISALFHSFIIVKGNVYNGISKTLLSSMYISVIPALGMLLSVIVLLNTNGNLEYSFIAYCLICFIFLFLFKDKRNNLHKKQSMSVMQLKNVSTITFLNIFMSNIPIFFLRMTTPSILVDFYFAQRVVSFINIIQSSLNSNFISNLRKNNVLQSITNIDKARKVHLKYSLLVVFFTALGFGLYNYTWSRDGLLLLNSLAVIYSISMLFGPIAIINVQLGFDSLCRQFIIIASVIALLFSFICHQYFSFPTTVTTIIFIFIHTVGYNLLNLIFYLRVKSLHD